MIINFSNIGSGSGGGGSVDPRQVREIVDSALTDYTADLEEGNPIVGMAKQLYSPDGVVSNGTYIFRTTGGEDSVDTGTAELREIGANTQYSNPVYSTGTTAFTSGPRVTASYTGSTDGPWLNPDFQECQATFTYTEGAWAVTSDSCGMFTSESGYSLTDFSFIGTPMENDAITWGSTSDGDTGYTAYTNYVYAEKSNTVSVDWVAFDAVVNNVAGTYEFTYDGSAWSSDIANHGITVTGTIIAGDKITIVYSAHNYGTLSDATPTSFSSLGLNSFNKATMAEEGKTIDSNGDIQTESDVYLCKVKAVTGLEDGYVIYSNTSAIVRVGLGDSETATTVSLSGAVQNSSVSVVYPANGNDIIYVATTDIDSICIHPRWSGYKDEVYEEYSISTLTLPALTDFISVGSTRNTLDLKNGKYIKRVEKIAATEALIQQYRNDAEMAIGVDYVFDGNHIYQVLSASVTSDVSVEDYEYKADDFSVEMFNGTVVPVYAVTYYMTNLVDKLRRDVLTTSNIVRLTQAEYNNISEPDESTAYIITDANAVDLDSYNDVVVVNSLTGAGESNKLYKYNGRYYKYVDTTGTTTWGEWLGRSGGYDSNIVGPNLLMLYYDYLPASVDGTKICALRAFNYTSNQKVLYWDLTNNQILVHGSETATPLEDTPLATIPYGGSATLTAYSSSYSFIVQWDEGRLTIDKRSVYDSIYDVCSTEMTGPHYEDIERDKAKPMKFIDSDLSNGAIDGIPVWNKEGVITGRKLSANDNSFQFNKPSNGNNYRHVLSTTTGFPSFYAPTDAGTSGQILQSNGGGAPTWSPFSSFIGGLSIVSCTQTEYDEMASHDANTIYIIEEE